VYILLIFHPEEDVCVLCSSFCVLCYFVVTNEEQSTTDKELGNILSNL